MVLVGDFFQLPPVELGKYSKTFAFLSPAWQLRTIDLKQVRAPFTPRGKEHVRL